MWKRLQAYIRYLRNTYGKVISCAVTGLVLLLAAFGSYQYYAFYASEIAENRFWSAVIYSTLQLYVFSPTVDVGESTPFLYEAAKWMAPVCTAYWMFKALESLVRHSMGLMKRRFSSRPQLVVFGYNENSRQCIENICAENMQNHNPADDIMLVLVTEEPIEKEEQLKLERNGVIVCQMDFLSEESVKMKADFEKLKLWKASEIILFYEDATLNFTIFSNLIKWISDSKNRHWRERLEKKEDIICAFQCNDMVVKKVVETYYSDPRAITKGKVSKETLETLFDLRMFSIPRLAAEKMFLEHPLYENCFPDPSSLKDSKERKGSSAYAKAFLKKMRNPHLLIAGLGQYGEAVLEQALLTGTFTICSEKEAYRKPRITVIDKNAAHCMQKLYARYPRLDKVCEIACFEMDARSSNGLLERELDRLPMITYAAVCFGNQTLSMQMMMQIAKYAAVRGNGQNIPITVRMEQDGAIVQYMQDMPSGKNQKAGLLRSYEQVFVFATKKTLLNRENLINARMEQKARQFHENYEREAEKIYGGGKEAPGKVVSWTELDFEGKESSRAQVLNQPFFRKLIEAVGPLPLRQNTQNPQEHALDSDMASRDAYSGPKLLDELAALEHKRWCNFACVYGYIGYGKKKREFQRLCVKNMVYYGQVHDCLIEDWEELKKDSQAGQTIPFDICALYEYVKMQAE